MKLLVPDYKIEPIFQHPDYPWYIGSPDALVIADDHKSGDYPIGGVDFKTTSSSYISDWGESGTDEVPAYYHTQAMWYMGLTNAKWWDIAVLFLGTRREFRIYRVMRDDDLISSLIEKGKEFWEQHVKLAIPPDVDASPGWDKYFKKAFPKEEVEELIDADVNINDAVFDIQFHRKEMKEQENIIIAAENKIKSFIGDKAGLNSIWGRITWRKSKDRVVTDWEQAFNMLKEICSISDKDAARLIKQNTTSHQGPRVFRTFWKKEDK